jgi:hypothetical protein
MIKVANTIRTVRECVNAYGGERAQCKAFKLTDSEFEEWVQYGVPQAHFLRVYIGLRLRNFEPSAELFGIADWSELPGVGRVKAPGHLEK